MEGNKILDTASELHTVNELLNKYVREQALSHEEKRGLWLFYKEFKDTNTLIDFAETVAHENIDKLLTDSQKLLGSDPSQSSLNSLYVKQHSYEPLFYNVEL